jgi:hypothetical protein
MSLSPRMLVPLVAVLGAVAALAGCGGSGGPKPEPSPRPHAAAKPGVTREQYIARADAYCKHAKETDPPRTELIQRAAAGADSVDEAFTAIAPLIAGAHDDWREEVDAFRAIEPPAADRAAIGMLWSNYEASVTALGRLAEAAGNRDLDSFNSLLRVHNALTVRGDELARRYGFHECGRRPQSGSRSRARKRAKG